MTRSKVFVPTQDGLVPVSFSRAYQKIEDRLLVSCESDWTEFAIELALLGDEPFVVTYEERGAREDGTDLRVSTRPTSTEEVRQLLSGWEEYVESDPRHNTTISSSNGLLHVTIDEHNLIIVTGDLDLVVRHLKGRQFKEGEVTLPTPHVHRDYEEFDARAQEFAQTLADLH